MRRSRDRGALSPRLMPAGVLALLLLHAGLPVAAQALAGDGRQHVVGDGVQMDCHQPQPETLDCRYRLLYGGSASQATATLGGMALPPPRLQPPSAVTGGALLIMVDTSDPARADVVAGKVNHVLDLLDLLPPGERAGVAEFDSDLRVLAAPATSDREPARSAARSLRAVGRTTEGYRSLLEAVRLLTDMDATRRTLLVLSDGLFEDRAYFHRDVVEAARTAGVVIHALGYARSISLSVALQTLRRLAEETGGLYSVASAGRALPSSFTEALLGGLSGGGRVTVDLAPGIAPGRSGGRQPVELQLLTTNGVARAQVLAEVPAPLPPLPEPPPMPRFPELPASLLEPLTQPDASTASQGDESATTTLPPDSDPPEEAPPEMMTAERSLLPGIADRQLVVAGSGVAAGTLLLGLLALLLRRRRPPVEPAPMASPMDTLAWLETEDGSGTRYPVMSALFRIGRHASNDLVLNDTSISRHHAQLQRHRDGTFSVRDLESLNGVLVNGDKVEEGVVGDGDLLEIGDVALRFRGEGGSQLPGEDTVILRTALPSQQLPGAARHH